MSDSRDQVFQGTSGSPRLRRIVLEFESFRDFIQAFSPVVSEHGMFVSAEQFSGDLPSAGEELNFEVTLTDDFRLVHGRGEVAWVRESDDSDGSAGAAVRFLDLDEPSRRLVSRLLTNYTKDGGRPFEIAATDSATGPAVEPEPLARSEADELFLPESDDETHEPELLDAIAPEDGEDEDAIPTMELNAATLAAIQDDVFELPDPSDSHLDEAEPFAEQAPELPEIELPDVLQSVEGGEIASASLDARSSGPVIPEDIAQLADELSGVHHVEPVEMPAAEDDVFMAGSGRAADDRPAWRTPLLASLAGIALAVAAWYFAGDQIKSLIGLGEGGGEPASVVAEAEVIPEAEAVDQASAEEAVAPEPEGTQAAPVEDTDVEEEVSATPAVQREEPRVETVESRPSAPAVVRVIRIEGITWKEGNGETVVSIVLDGPASDELYEVVRIRQGEPREVIKISGVSEPFSPKQLDVGTGHLHRLRSGLHSTAAGSEIHLVADLTGPGVAVTLVRTQGNTILVTFS